jgi:hypothetical protein
MNRTMRSRLAKIEASRPGGRAPTFLLSGYPISDEVAREALVRWRELVADGCASANGEALYLMAAEVTKEEWERERCGSGGDEMNRRLYTRLDDLPRGFAKTTVVN